MTYFNRHMRFLMTTLIAAALLVGGGHFVGGGISVLAVEPDEILSDPKLEARARALSANLRCLVCQNQSIDDSDAPLARDLRVLVRERLTAGDTDEAVIDFVVARYGEFVLLSPRFGTHTLLLWLSTPFLLLLTGLLMLFAYRRGQKQDGARPVALDESEKKKLEKILSNK